MKIIKVVYTDREVGFSSDEFYIEDGVLVVRVGKLRSIINLRQKDFLYLTEEEDG